MYPHTQEIRSLNIHYKQVIVYGPPIIRITTSTAH